MPKLTDPWFEAQFYGRASAGGFTDQGEQIEGSQGLWLWCPCGYGHPRYPLDGGRPHAIMVPFANPRNAPQVPPEHGPESRTGGPRPRWTMAGTGLHDLTLSPSVDVGQPSCWHGFVLNGEVI